MLKKRKKSLITEIAAPDELLLVKKIPTDDLHDNTKRKKNELMDKIEYDNCWDY
jgi:hypothetical protein